MKRFWLIASAIITIGTIIFAYGRRYIGKLSYDIDFIPSLRDFNLDEGSVILPFRIFIDNKNKKSVTAHNLDVEVYDSKNVLLAESVKTNKGYKIEGFKNNIYDIDFKVFVTGNLINVIKDSASGNKTKLFLIVSFTVFLIPISKKVELVLND